MSGTCATCSATRLKGRWCCPSTRRPRSPPAPGATPVRPAGPGEPAREEFEYRRHGTASLVAALDVRTGEVLTEIIARNDAAAFTAFLDQLDTAIAPGQDIHVVLDNGSSHTAKHTKAWLANHPRWHVHWTPPHASWLNQIELFFSVLTRRVLRHGDFSSRDDLCLHHEPEVLMTHANARLTFHGRCLLVCRVVQDLRPAAHVAKELGVSRQCAHRWVARFRAEGREGLHDRSSPCAPWN